MQKIINSIHRIDKYVVILLFISIITHLQWFNFNSILTSGDWMYWPSKTLGELWNSYLTWLNFDNLGSPNIQINFNIFNLIWSLIGQIGFNYDTATKITFMIPIAILGFLSPYYLVRQIQKDRLIAFICALFYGSTTYYLTLQTSHLPIVFVYAVFPLLFLYFLKALEQNKVRNWIYFSLIYFVTVCYEPRIALIASVIIFFYFLLFHFTDAKIYFKNLLIFIFIFIFLNLFWLLPSLKATGSIETIANRGLFGNNLFDLMHAFTLFDWAWTGGTTNINFVMQPIPLYFWLVPVIIIFLPLIFIKNNSKIYFYTFLAVLGIFLTKQSDSPLKGAYEWLYNNIPGFNLFREASKFYLLTSFAYLMLLSYILVFFKSHKHKLRLYLICGIIAIISFINLKPLYTGEMRTLFVARTYPADYQKFENLVKNQNDFFRTLWVPVISRWSYFDNIHPRINGLSLIPEYSEKYGIGQSIYSENDLVNLLQDSGSGNLVDLFSIKYVIVPLEDTQNEDNFFVYYSGDRQAFIDSLNRVTYLQKIEIGMKDLAVYENRNYRPHLYLTDESETISKKIPYETVDYELINPTEYRIKIKNLRNPKILNFSEAHNQGWRLKAGSFSWFSALKNNNYFLSSDIHLENNAQLNSFEINPKLFKEKYSKDIKINPDGSIDLELTLYYSPQLYMNLGLVATSATLLFCLIYLTMDFRARRIKIKQCKSNL